MAIHYDDDDIDIGFVRDEVNKYLEQYGKAYSIGNFSQLKDYYEMFFYLQSKQSLYEEVFSHLNLRRKQEDMYQQDLELVEHYFSLNARILEAGCGWYPAFAERLAERQAQLQGGTITVYDPRLVATSLPGIVLHKEKFTKEIKLSQEIDLYCGFAPCEATLPLIDLAKQEHKPLVLRVCSCHHFPAEETEKQYADFEDGWWRYVEDYTRASLHSDEELIVDHISVVKDPVLIKRYKK